MLTQDQLLDELDGLAPVEHSLIVEYLLVHAVLGHDIPAVEGDPISQRLHQAAEAAFWTGVGEMRHLHRLNTVLTRGGRAAEIDRAPAIDGHVLAAVASTTAPGTISALLDRERRIAAATDDRYLRLRAAFDPATIGNPPWLEDLMFILEPGLDHRGSLSGLEEALQGAVPTDAVRLGLREPADQVERGLLDLSDGWYGLLLAIVDAWFNHEDQLGGVLPGRADAVMTKLNAVNLAIVERGLLPRFTAPDL